MKKRLIARTVMATMLCFSMSMNAFAVETINGETDFQSLTEENEVVDVAITIDETTVDVPLTDVDNPETEIDETQNTVKGDSVGTTIVEGDAPESAEDDEYDYTESTVVNQSSVTVTTKEITTTSNASGSNAETDMDYIYTDTIPTADNDLFTYKDYATEIPESKEEFPEITEGYEYGLLGTGNSSQFYAGWLYKTPSPDNPDEEPAYVAADGTKYYARRTDLTNRHKLEGVYLNGEMVADTDTVYKALWSNIAQYILFDAETGELITTYCADVATSTEDGYSYNIENIEDASYYTEEQAKMIRTIALNGYWGTEDDPVTNEAELGSLEAVKNMMRNARDTDGNTVFTEEEINSLTDGIAMTATQYAIWTFSNYMDEIEFVNAQYIIKDANNEGKGWSYSHLNNIPQEKMDSVALIFKLYEYLIHMEPTGIEENTTANTVINTDNFLKNLSLTVINKADGHENNQDEDNTNDAYVTNLTFALVVTPVAGNGDDLVVRVLDSAGNVLACGRIAGEAKDGEEILQMDADGNYTFNGIVLTEGNQNFHITLSGIQNLEQGVYIYSSEVKEGISSQTMVGIAEGKHTVDVSMNICFELSVEDEVVVTERFYKEKNKDDAKEDSEDILEDVVEDNSKNTVLEPETNSNIITLTDPQVPLGNTADDNFIEIVDEEVPLADAPKTGNFDLGWLLISLLSGIGLAGLELANRRKRKTCY